MGYEGRIKNSGAQVVEAHNNQERKYSPKVIRGDDLRTNAGSSGKK